MAQIQFSLLTFNLIIQWITIKELRELEIQDQIRNSGLGKRQWDENPRSHVFWAEYQRNLYPKTTYMHKEKKENTETVKVCTVWLRDWKTRSTTETKWGNPTLAPPVS